MARPKKPEDPEKWILPCQRCGKHYQIVANWPDANICAYCYQAAKRTRGICACGHDGILPGIINGHPACRTCSGVVLNVDCKGCGAEDELYTGGKCQRCVFGDTLDRLLTNPATGVVAAELNPMILALKEMRRPNSGLIWIRQPHVDTFLKALAAEPRISQETLDKLPSSHTLNHVRGLLVEHAVLPRRDELLSRYERWAEQAIKRVDDLEHRDVIERFIRWGMLRRMRGLDHVPNGTFLRSKQTVTVAIDFCNWLSDQETSIHELNQAHLDAWQAGGPSTREFVSRFLTWTRTSKITAPDLSVTPHRRGTSQRMPAADQQQTLNHIVHTSELSPHDQLAAILILVFGQQMESVVTVTWEDITVTEEAVILHLTNEPIRLPAPLDGPVRQLLATPLRDQTASHPNSPWVFRGQRPGQHIEAVSMRERLKPIFSTRAARLGTLHELTRIAPVAIIAEVLGYHPQTIARHARSSATAYARYIADRRQDPEQLQLDI